MNIREIKKPVNPEVVKMLNEWLALAEKGTLISVCLVGRRSGGEWMTSASSSENALEDAAMLLELGFRRMGFKQ